MKLSFFVFRTPTAAPHPVAAHSPSGHAPHPAFANRLTQLSGVALIALACAVAPTGAQAKAKASRAVQTSSAAHPNPDTLLTEIYADMAAGNLRSAQAKADRLVEAYPKFHLAHLIRGDLLMMHANPVNTLGAVPSSQATAKLPDLRAEAVVRMKTLHLRRPDPDLTPRAFTQLRDNHHYAVLVSTNLSRLFVYKNVGGKLVLLNHYYVSQGKLGAHKTREGDQRTPIGIYRITGRIPGAKLPDFYGSGALPLSYPNDWEKLHGKNGSGIWLHGMPSDSFSRPPLASDGCVVLTNPDFIQLGATIDINKTLVVISDKAEFANNTVMNKDRKLGRTLVEKWRRDIEYGNRRYLRQHYSEQFRSSTNEDLNTWFDKQHPTNVYDNVSYKLHNLSLMRYPGPGNLIAAAFSLDIRRNGVTTQSRRFQLWKKEGAAWKIVYENTIKDFL